MSPQQSEPALERAWLSADARRREQEILTQMSGDDVDATDERIHALVASNRTIHETDCINLNPATNVMNPRAEALLASGLSTRASLGHPGDKYEMGLEAIEEIEVIAAALVRRVFNARHAELRVASGAMANLTAFMATTAPGDSIIVPPPEIGGHITHQASGAAGLYGLDIHHCPIDPGAFTLDLEALEAMTARLRPTLITIGTSLNLLPHPVAEIRQIADRHDARVLFDAAHACGMIAGGVWPNPLAEGAHVMTMSTYKSLGGPAAGLVLTDDAELAERIDAVAYPGLTANFDVAKTAALALTVLDWTEHGERYARTMADNAGTLAAALAAADVPVWSTDRGHTTSHQLAVDATAWGGGHAAARQLRRGNLLGSAIGLPGHPDGTGLRLGTPEVTRLGMGADEMAQIATLIASGLRGEDVAEQTTSLRRRFTEVHFART